jgi:uncharacterized membrane protein YgaE (UPF0421/DUF939 family)
MIYFRFRCAMAREAEHLGADFALVVGTALGAVFGAIAAVQVGPHVLVFGTCVFILGVLCAMAGSDRNAFRFGGLTVAIVFLVPVVKPAWQIASHRFAEVSIGIGVALLFSIVWPEEEGAPMPFAFGLRLPFSRRVRK